MSPPDKPPRRPKTSRKERSAGGDGATRGKDAPHRGEQGPARPEFAGSDRDSGSWKSKDGGSRGSGPPRDKKDARRGNTAACRDEAKAGRGESSRSGGEFKGRGSKGGGPKGRGAPRGKGSPGRGRPSRPPGDRKREKQERAPRGDGRYEMFVPAQQTEDGWHEQRVGRHEPHVLFVATKNPGKAREIAELLEGVPLKVVGPTLIRNLTAPVEDGATFEANAIKKALHYSRLVDYTVLADDSGIEIDALDGKPGVRSARLGGPAATDNDRVRLVLRMLEGVPWEERTARFRCSVAIARGDNLLATFDGAVEGMIAFEPKGASGFGYDPVFHFEEAGRTFAEMTSAEKHRVSHRGEALGKAVAWLRERVAEHAL